MKRLLSLFLALISLSTLVILSACNSNRVNNENRDSFNYKTDFQYYYNSLNGTNLPMTKSESGYYVFLPNRFLYYIDNESMETTPLCNKVNCLHNDKECGAYFNLLATPSDSMNTSNIVQYYEDSLYMVIKEEDEYGNFEGNSLYKVSLDGVTREKLVYFEGSIPHWIIHRGNFYYTQVKFSDDVESAIIYDSFSIRCLSLDDLRKAPIEVFNSKNYCDNIQASYQFTAYGDYIFTSVWSLSSQAIEEYLNEGKWSISFESQYYSINIESFDINQISNDEGEVVVPSFYNGKLLYSIKNDDPNSRFRYYLSELDGSNPTFLREMEYGDNLFSNGDQLYLQNLTSNFDESQETLNYDKVSMLDSDFEETSAFIIPFKYAVMNIPQDPNKFIFVRQIDNSNTEIYCIDKSKLESIDGTEAEYKTVYSSLGNTTTAKNSISEVNLDVKIETTDSALRELFKKTQQKLYNVSSAYDSSLSDNISGGFSVKLHWSGDGGNYTANFQVLKFKSISDVSSFVKDNPFSLVNDKYVVFVSIETVPVEIKNMLISIIENDPITPIEIFDFSGELYSFT